MALSKTVFRSKVYSGSPVNKLPTELLHMICSYLKPTEIAKLRLVSRFAATLGLQHLVPKVHLVLTKSSFDQLQAIAEHPIISKHITGFLYQADMVSPLDQAEWEEDVQSPEYKLEEQRVLSHRTHCLSLRGLRSHNRDLIRFAAMPHHQYTQQQLNQAWSNYHDICVFQEYYYDSFMLQSMDIARALKCFPNLKTIIMSTYGEKDYYRGPDDKAFESAHVYSWRQHDPKHPVGVPQVRSLLLGALEAGLKITALRCGEVSWRLLLGNDSTFARMKKSISNLEDLKLDFSTGFLEVDREVDNTRTWYDVGDAEEIEACSAHLREGRLKDFVTSAPNLIHLDVEFACQEPSYATDLEYVVGDYQWHSLRVASFAFIECSEDDLVAFCERHAGTLQGLFMGCMHLTTGNWSSALSRMHKVLTLKYASVWGRLRAVDGDEETDLQKDGRLMRAIGRYLTGYCKNPERSFQEYFDWCCSEYRDNRKSMKMRD